MPRDQYPKENNSSVSGYLPDDTKIVSQGFFFLYLGFFKALDQKALIHGQIPKRRDVKVGSKYGWKKEVFFLNIKNSEIKELLKWLAKAMEEVKEVCFLLTLEKSPSLPLSLSALGLVFKSNHSPFPHQPFGHLQVSKKPATMAPRVESAMRKIEVSSTVC